MKQITKNVETGKIRVQTVNTKPSLTQQNMKDQTDVNKIIKKYMKTGEWTHLSKKQGAYGDVSQITDYQQCMQKVLDANSAFASLPSQLRLRFENDPSKLLEFIQNVNNKEEAISLGLIDKPEEKLIPTEEIKT